MRNDADKAEFVHLNVHSEYALVDSIIHHSNLLEAVLERGMNAVAITDACNFFGAVKFYRAACKYGVKPIFGTDILIVSEQDESTYYLTLLAENQTGYQNIVDLISKAYMTLPRSAVQALPMIPKSWLISLSMQGVIALSAGRRGELAKYPTKIVLDFYLKCFGITHFYIGLECLDHPDDEMYLKKMTDFACENQVPVVAINDVRFIDDQDYETHEIKVGIFESYTLAEADRKSQFTTQQYLKTPSEMAKLFKHIPSALINTVEIAKRCNVCFELGQVCLPQFDIPSTLTEAEYFAQATLAGMEKRWTQVYRQNRAYNTFSQEEIQTHYKARLATEISVIREMGFSGYFLIVADFIQWAQKSEISVGPGRGSGAGSLVAYALGITNVDPIIYHLLFERFLNPERVSMPDFDIDFCMEGRDRVVDYVAQKYGRESVSQIITFGTMSAKAVVRDVGRVLNHPYGLVDKIAKLIPNDLGVRLSDAIEEGMPLYRWMIEDEAVKSIIDESLKLEGTIRSVGRHAAGVVISPSKVSDFAPVYCEEGTSQLVAQFDKKDVEDVGLVKFDFLGLRNLTIIDHALKMIEASLGTHVDIDLIPMDDVATYDLLKAAHTTGIFQLESQGMKELIVRLAPDCFEDVIALVALYRPGPLGSGMVDDFVNRKHGREKVTYPHESLALVLKETYGTILYQEQVMQIAQILAKYTLGAADMLRRAMGKKIAEEMAQQRSIFEQGAQENGVDSELASAIFDLMEEFAKYGFNKSHSAAYALIAYQTAYLKAHYPAYFMASLLSSDMDKTDKVVTFILDLKTMHLSLSLPDVNQSEYTFTVSDEGQVIYGLGAIKGLGESIIQSIVNERKKNGPYQDLYDFCSRLDLKKMNKRVFDALIYSGALDSLAPTRSHLIVHLEDALKRAEQTLAMESSGQGDMFGGMSAFKPVWKVEHQDFIPLLVKVQLQKEKAVLGVTLSAHFIDAYQAILKEMPYLISMQSVLKMEPRTRQDVTMAGILSKKHIRRIKSSGKNIMILEVEASNQESLEIPLFGEALISEYQELLILDDLFIFDLQIQWDSLHNRQRIKVKHIYRWEAYFFKVLKGFKVFLDAHPIVQEGVQAPVKEDDYVDILLSLFKTASNDHQEDQKGVIPLKWIMKSSDEYEGFAWSSDIFVYCDETSVAWMKLLDLKQRSILEFIF